MIRVSVKDLSSRRTGLNIKDHIVVDERKYLNDFRLSASSITPNILNGKPDLTNMAITEEYLCLTITIYRKPGLELQEFVDHMQKIHAVICADLMEQYGIVEYTQVRGGPLPAYCCCSIRPKHHEEKYRHSSFLDNRLISAPKQKLASASSFLILHLLRSRTSTPLCRSHSRSWKTSSHIGTTSISRRSSCQIMQILQISAKLRK